jgi:hypothetical protein
MAVTFRTTKVQNFIKKKIEYMKMQQKMVEDGKKLGLPVDLLESRLEENFNYTRELCKEFKLEIPEFLGGE